MNEQRTPRWINVVVGLWLFMSAFLWAHTPAHFTNTWIVGALCAGAAVVGTKIRPMRFVNVGLAVWLFVGTWLFPGASSATLWNNLIAAIIMLVVALTPNSPAAVARH